MKSILTAVSAIAMAVAVPTAPAMAQDAATVQPGMTVVNANDDSVVGTVTALKDGNVVVKTDKYEVALPANSFTPNEGKLLFAMSQADLNAAVEADMAKAKAALAAGAHVMSQDGVHVGTLEAIDDQYATIALSDGGKIKIPANGVAGSPNGAVIGLTAAQLKAQTAAGQAAEAADTAAEAAEEASEAAEASAEAADAIADGGTN